MKRFTLFYEVKCAILLLVAVLFTSLNSLAQLGIDPSPDAACSPSEIQFDIVNGLVGATYDWDFGNTNFLPNALVGNLAAANYGPPGVYTVTLSQDLTTDTARVPVEIYPNPNPILESKLIGCAPFDGVLTVQLDPVVVEDFTLISLPFSSDVGGITGGFADSITWNFLGDIPTVGQKLTLSETSATYNVTGLPVGSYDLFFTVIDEHGCEKAIFIPEAIIVYDPLSVDFNYSKLISCGVGNVDFTGIVTNTAPGASTYEWEIDGNPVSPSLDFTRDFSVAGAGDYDVKLIVTNGVGCTDSVTKTVSFNDDNTVGFSYSDTCVNGLTSFADNSTDPLNVVLREWDFNNDGTFVIAGANSSYTFTTTGAQTVTLRVTFDDGCILSTSKTFQIIGAIAGFSYDASVACAPFYNVSFTSNIDPSVVSWSWDFNGGGEDSIVPNPTWDFGNSGAFPVGLTVTTADGCVNTKTSDVVIIEPSLEIDATPVIGCVPLSVDFAVNYNKVAEDPIVSYSWDFDDGSPLLIGNHPTPSQNYLSSGTDTVQLSVTTTNGCVLTAERVISVGEEPVVFDVVVTPPAGNCVKDSFYFEAITSGVQFDSIIWIFGDAPLDTISRSFELTNKDSLYHFFQTANLNDSVTAQAFYRGCPSQLVTINNINVNFPSAEFSVSSNIGCSLPTTIDFTNLSDEGSDGSSYEWNFGDPASLLNDTSTVENPFHEYTTAGDYEITLIVTDSFSTCTDTFVDSVYISTASIIIDSDVTAQCAGANEFINFNSTLSDSSNFSPNYSWRFGDGNTSNNADPSHAYLDPGLYEVTVAVTDEHGCVHRDTIIDSMDIEGPIVDFTNNGSVCVGTPISFTNSTTYAANDEIKDTGSSYLWKFGDGDTSTDENSTHAYSAPDNYSVTLIVTSQNGCVNSISKTSNVAVPTLIADISSNDYVCVNENINLDGSGSRDDIDNYSWDLDNDGDYSDDTDATASTSFALVGTYPISLAVENSLGCKDTITKNIEVVDGDGLFTVSPVAIGCAPTLVTFTSTDDPNVVASYSWDFGNGRISTDDDPSNFYPYAGEYTVTLTETLVGGCQRSSSQTVIVNGAYADFSYSNTPGCINHPEEYYAINIYGADSITWDFGDGSTETEAVPVGVDSMAIQHVYKTYGSRLPKIILKDMECGNYFFESPDLLKRINTSEPPIVAIDMVSSDDTLCVDENNTFTFNATISDPRYTLDEWQWDFDNDGTYDTFLESPAFAYPDSGLHTINLRIRTIFITEVGHLDTVVGHRDSIVECWGEITRDVYVKPLPEVSIENDSTEICSGDNSLPIILTSPNDTNSTYDWTLINNPEIITTALTNGSSDTIPASEFINLTQEVQTVKFIIEPTGSDPTSCAGPSDTAYVIVNPSPIVSSESELNICSGEAVNYQITSEVPGTTFLWSASREKGTVLGFLNDSTETSSIISDTLSNASGSNGQVTYLLTPIGPAPTYCVGLELELVVNVLNCQPVIGVSKQLVSTEYNADGTAEVLFNIRVQNYGNVLLDSIQVTEDLNALFGVDTFEVIGLSSTSFDVNTSFNGSTIINLLSNSGTVNTLDVDASTDISLRLKILESGSYINQVTASSTTGGGVSDDSQDGSDPDDGSSTGSENGDGDPKNNNVPTPVVIEDCSLTASVTNSTCGNSAGAVTLTGSEAGIITLNDSTQTGISVTYSDLQAGWYSATFVADATACISSVSFEITNSNSDLTGSVTDHQDVLCNGGNDGFITVVASGGTGAGSYDYKLVDGATLTDGNGTFTDLSAGEYAVRITDNNGCTYTVSFDIEEPTQLVASLTGVTDASCGATNDASAVIDITGGTPPYLITIDSFPAASSGTEELVNGIIVRNMYEGTYKIIVTDDNSCVDLVYVPIGAIACGVTDAVNDTLIATEDITLIGDLAVNDTVSSSGVNIWTVVNTPDKGSVIIYNNGTFEYIPEPNSFGVDSFSYMLCDVNADCDTAWAFITVASVDDQPDAVADNLNVPEDATTSIQVLDNDNWGGDGAGTITVTADPSNGSAIVNNNGTPSDPSDDFIDYTPDPDFNGFDSFEYEICDADDPADCDIATVDVNVAGINDEPTAVDDTYLDALEDTPYSSDLSDNDTESADGVNIWTVLDDPARGTVTIDNDGTFEYIPAADSFGVDSFSYMLCDVNADCDTAWAFITVASVDDQPDAVADNLNVPEDATTSIQVLDNDNWGGDGAGTITVTADPSNGSAIVNNNGTPSDPSDDFIDYTPDPDFNGFDSFEYRICDEDGDCDVATVNINVAGVNDVPIALLDSVETDEDIPLTGLLTVNDTISGDGANDWSVDTQPEHGTVTVNVDGTFEYLPEVDYNGLDSFYYKLCDIDNQCDTAKVIVTVNPVNDPPVIVADLDTTIEDTDVSFSIIINDNDIIDGSIIDPGTIDLNPATVGIDTFFVVTGEGVYSIDTLTGILTFDPDTNFFGTTTPILYKVCDTGIPAPAECGTATITIEVLPVNDAPIAGIDVLLNQQNPGGINIIQIPAGKFSGTDVDGTISTIVITALPDSVASITVDGIKYSSIPVGGINVASTPDGQPIFDIEIDPLDTVSDIVLEYYVIDNEGLISEDPGSVTITFNELTIAGNVYNDINGLTDNLVSGAGTNLDDNLYVNLVNDLNQVLSSTAVNSDGTYQFNEADGLSLDANFKVIITDGIQNVSDILSEAILPDTLRSIGENIGAGLGNDGMPDGIININTAPENIGQLSNLNFGIVHVMVMAEPDPTDANCDSNEDGSVQLSVLSDNIGTVTYELSTGETNTSGYFEGLAAGGYIYTATDEDEYSVSGSFSIDDPNELELTIFEEIDDTCFNSSTGSARVFAAGGTLPYTFDWNGNPVPAVQDSISIAENLPAGIYVVTVTDALGCKEIETIEIEQPDSLNILLVDLVYPDCDAAGEVKIIGTGGVAPYTYTSNYGTVNEDVISDVYSGTLTVTITDANGCTNSIDIPIEDIDVTPPQIDLCSVNDTAGVDFGVCYADISLIPPVASDNCDTTSLIMSFRVISPDNSISTVIDTAVTTTYRFMVGTSRIEWNIADHTGNISECIQMVTVIEDEDPVITKCPANSIFANTSDICGYVVPDDTLNAEATDNCELVSLTHNFGEWGNSSSLEGATFPIGTTDVLWIAEDASGNRDSCTTTIVVEDIQNPEFVNCPDGDTMTIALFSSVCEGSAIWSIPIASDNCGDVSVDQTSGPDRGSPVAAGFYDIEYVATDLADNTDTCVFTIEVIDTDDPIAICPPDFHKDNDEGECSWTAPASSVSPLLATSNCPFEVLYDITGATIAGGNDDASGTEFNLGTSVVTYTVNDTVNNQTWSCDFQVVVYDKEAPSIACEGPINTNVTPGECYSQIDLVPPTAFDNCDTTNIIMTFEVWAADNSRSLVIDTATITSYNFAVGVNQVIWTATDQAGNEATCVQEVTVLEDEDPIISCPITTVFTFNVEPGMCGVEIGNTDLDATATDNCVMYTMSHNYGDWALQNTLQGAFFPVGSTDVTWTATDVSGNTSSCTITVTVIDNEIPEFVNCPSNTTFIVALFADACEGGSVWSIPVARDNCSDVSVSQIEGPALGTILPVGLHNITYRAQDRAGNTTTCSFAINVVDTEDPVVVCQPNIVIENDPGECSWLSPQSSLTPLLANSNCPSVVSWTVENPDGSIQEGTNDVSGYEFELGISTVSYSIDEIASGQDWDCSFTVTVEDTEAPVIDCQPTLQIIADAGECSSIVDMIPPVSSDNCSNDFETYFRVFGPENSTGDLIEADSSTYEFNNGISRVEWTVFDEAGNKTKCWQDVWISPDVDALIPDAGVNASICETDESFATTAVAPNYSNIVWTTSGTGSFTDSEQINTSYIPSVNDIDDGFVVLTITSSIDCATTSDQMLLRITHPPLVSAGDDASICETSDYQLHGTLINSVSSVLWSSLGTGSFSMSNVFNPVYSPSQADIEAGEVELVFRGISNSSCADELDTMKLFIDRLPILNAGDDASICEGDNFALSVASVQHGTEIEWTTSGTGTFVDNTQINTSYIPSESDILNGGVILAITHLANGDCEIVADDLQLNISKQSEVLAGVDARICENEDFQLDGVVLSGVSSVEWSSTGSGTFSNKNVFNPVYTPGLTDIEAGQVELIFKGISGSTCSDDLDTLILIIDRMPIVNAGDEAWICEGESFVLSEASLQHSGIIEWSTNGTGTFEDITALQAVYNPSVSDVLNGTVVLTLSVTNDGECDVVRDEMTLNISKTPSVEAGENISTCFSQEIQINGATAVNYETLIWSTNGTGTIENAETLSPVYVPTNEETGVITMTLTITSARGCQPVTLADELELEILPPLIVDVGVDQTIHSSSVAKLSVDVTNGSGSYFYNWEPEGSVIDPSSNYTKTVQLLGTTTFGVTVTDDITGCVASDELTITVEQDAAGVVSFYRGFSPNNDGVNDTWSIKGIENFPENKVMIFNRWGDKVRHLENYNNTSISWDGTNEKGEDLPDGTYYYLVELENVDEFTGWVHIRTDR